GIGYHAFQASQARERNRAAEFASGSRCLVRVDPIWKVSRHKPFIISLKPRLQLQQLYPGAMNDMQLPCPLILASSSPYRPVLLRRLGLPLEQLSPAVDESPRPGE